MTLVPGARRVSALTRIPCPISACAIIPLLLWICLGTACTDRRARAPIDESGPPVRGGTLELVGGSDPNHLATTSTYWSYTWALFRTFSRQLLAYPPAADYTTATQPTADLAIEVPSRENGGISADGLRYTFHLRRGVRWDSNPPREVTAHDVVRGFRMLCNPVSPSGALAYYTGTIAGMAGYCERFSRVPGTVPGIREFVNTEVIEGVRAADDFTIVFSLRSRASDFLDLVTMTFASPVPVEYLDYLPDSPESRQHTLSDGPYRIARYIPNGELLLERNPVWDRSTDSIRPAHVDRIRLRVGMDAQLQHLQIEAGTADLSFDETVPAAELASLLSADDPRLWTSPPGDRYGEFLYLALNQVGPNNRGALKKIEVRQAVELAVDKAAIVQLLGGPRIARPLRQAVLSSAGGFRDGVDHYVTTGDRGDPATARRRLAGAGYPGRFVLRLAFPTTARSSLVAQSLQASLGRAGIDVVLVSLVQGDFYNRFLPGTESAQRGAWDLALVGWAPDWFGENNGRSVISPLFDGRSFGPGTQNYGGYNSTEVNAFIDSATTAPSPELAERAWHQAAQKLMEDAAIVPLIEDKNAYARSRRVRNCTWSVFGGNCDINALWLADGGKDRK